MFPPVQFSPGLKHEGMMNFVKYLFFIDGDDLVVFVFQSNYVLYVVNSFMYVEPSLHLWYESTLVMVEDLLDMCLYAVCKYFAENFCIYVH